jgi:hypothetical protein
MSAGCPGGLEVSKNRTEMDLESAIKFKLYLSMGLAIKRIIPVSYSNAKHII